MSLLMAARAANVERQRAATAFGRADYRVRLTKIFCAISLGICFWFSVPYYLPLKVDPDPIKAAQNEAQAYEGNVTRQVAMPIVALFAAYMLWRLPKRGRFGGRLLIVAAMYVGWAVVSFTWSEDPSISMKRLVVFAIDVFFAFTIARVFSVLEMALWGFAATGIVGLLSLYIDALQEKIFAPFDPNYRFTGVMTANYQAMNLLVCVVCALIVLQRRPKWIGWIAPSVMLALTLMYLTRARLSTIICLLLMTIMLTRTVRVKLQPQTRALVVIAGLTIVLPALIYSVGKSGGDVAESAFMMGRTDTQNTSNLSNRAPLWAELMESVETRPWLGFGYEAFWAPVRVEKVSADQGWMVPHAHNTYLDQTLSLGVIGAALYIGMMLGATIVAWRRYWRHPTETDMLPAVLLTWVVLTGVAESVPLDPYLPTMLAYACVVKMCMIEGSERESDVWVGPGEFIGGLTPGVVEGTALAEARNDRGPKHIGANESFLAKRS